MKWIVHLTVVLLNILWVAFFLMDPLAVFVQKRSSSSSDEDMIVGEFCLQTPSDLMWTSTPGPADVSTDKTRTTSDVYAAPKTAASEPPSIHLNEATTAAPPVHIPTFSEVIPVIFISTSEAAPVTKTWHEQYHDNCCPAVTTAKVPRKVTPFKGSVPRREERHRSSSGSDSVASEKCCFSYYSGRLRKSNIISVQHTNRLCPKPGVILTTRNGVSICVNPSVQWIKKIINNP